MVARELYSSRMAFVRGRPTPTRVKGSKTFGFSQPKTKFDRLLEDQIFFQHGLLPRLVV